MGKPFHFFRFLQSRIQRVRSTISANPNPMSCTNGIPFNWGRNGRIKSKLLKISRLNTGVKAGNNVHIIYRAWVEESFRNQMANPYRIANAKSEMYICPKAE